MIFPILNSKFSNFWWLVKVDEDDRRWSPIISRGPQIPNPCFGLLVIDRFCYNVQTRFSGECFVFKKASWDFKVVEVIQNKNKPKKENGKNGKIYTEIFLKKEEKWQGWITMIPL